MYRNGGIAIPKIAKVQLHLVSSEGTGSQAETQGWASDSPFYAGMSMTRTCNSFCWKCPVMYIIYVLWFNHQFLTITYIVIVWEYDLPSGGLYVWPTGRCTSTNQLRLYKQLVQGAISETRGDFDSMVIPIPKKMTPAHPNQPFVVY